MFTGIITTIGKIKALQPKGGDLRFQVATQKSTFMDVSSGNSVAINGVCLTVANINSGTFIFDVSRESLDRTNLGNLMITSKVNLEKALAVEDRLGGHFVSGHVDGLGSVISIIKSARSFLFGFAISRKLECYIAEKGSISIDGVSLTVNNVGKRWFEVNIIPHTMQKTIISTYQIGSKVNLEVDLIARYLELLLLKDDLGITQDYSIKHELIK